MKRFARRWMVPGAALCALSLITPAAAGERGRGVDRPTAGFNSEVAVEWSHLLYDRIRAERLPPMVAARVIAYTEVALYEAVVPGMPDHRSLGGQLNGLGTLPRVDPKWKYHWPTVANRAMAATLRGLLPAAAPETVAAIAALEARLQQTYRAAVPPPFLARSVLQGNRVAAAILQWASADGFATLNNCAYTPPAGPGLWVPTPPAFRPALQPCWGQLRTFALPTADTCAPPPPPAYSTDPASAFYVEAKEVQDTVNGLTPAQRETALFWSDDPGVTGTPAGHSLMIATEVAEQDSLSLDKAAEGLARVGIAVADAFIGCWKTKYIYNLLRPVTYIQETIGDPAWMPILVTPPFPEYTSGHSVQSGAAAEVLTDLFGPIPFTDYTHANRGFAPRAFPDFYAAAHEAAISRLYGGIHYRSAIERGVEQGTCIGRSVLERVHFSAEGENH
jgi:PAP2 superfamily